MWVYFFVYLYLTVYILAAESALKVGNKKFDYGNEKDINSIVEAKGVMGF